MLYLLIGQLVMVRALEFGKVKGVKMQGTSFVEKKVNDNSTLSGS